MEKSVFIGCSSRDKIDSHYFEMADRVSKAIASDYELVFGACNRGLMGSVYRSFLEEGKTIYGVTPHVYEDDLDSLECTYASITNTTNERMDEIISISDAMVFLPGGPGTYAEIFNCFEEKRTNKLEYPIILYNEDHHFDLLLMLLEDSYQKGFADVKDRCHYQVVYSVLELKEALEQAFLPVKVYQKGRDNYDKSNNG